MKKEVIFQAKFQTDDFDRSVESMKKKLQEISAPADRQGAQNQNAQRMGQMGLGAGLSEESLSGFRRATQSAKREMDQLITSQFRGQQDLGKAIAQQEMALKKLVNEQKNLTKSAKEHLEISKEISRIRESAARMNDSYARGNEGLNNSMDAREEMNTKDRFGPGGGFGLMKRFA